jgi:hypothetical protein
MLNDVQNSPSFERPIPGQGLTAELGARPWQNPPQYNTVEEALDYYVPRLVNPEFMGDLLDVIETGLPLTTIAEAMQNAGVMEGKHTIDVGILIMPVLIETMAYLAEEAGIDYEAGSNKTIDSDKISPSRIALIMKEIKDEEGKEPDPLAGAPVREEEPPQQEESEEQSSGGLMSRRKTNGV